MSNPPRFKFESSQGVYFFHMDDVMWRILWIAAIAILIFYACFLFFGGVLFKMKVQDEVIVFDKVTQGRHKLSGVLTVPSACHGLSVKVLEHGTFAYHLAFETWQEPSRDCPRVSSYRSFHSVAFAPSLGVTFTATLDNRSIPLHILESYD